MRKLILSNVAEGTHAGNVTKVAEVAISQKYLLCKLNSSGNVSIAGGADCPIGVTTDEAEIGDFVNIALLGACDTVKMVTSGGISAGEIVVVDNGGKVKTFPSSTNGTYYQVGIALVPAVANGIVECVSCLPVKHVVSGA
jgi:hypothetical protein